MKVVLLSGGVGGARMAGGLDRVLPAGDLSVIVNTGDDFDHWGLRICPDLDTVTYTLAGVADPSRGWGLRDETFKTFEMVGSMGGDDWFQLGDRDLATHLYRTHELASGRSLTEVTCKLANHWGTGRTILPMSDGPRPTWVDTVRDGRLSFQDWLVRRRALPPVSTIDFGGDDGPTEAVLSSIEAADVVIIAPSNPYVSIDPILALQGVRERLEASVVVGVSPIVAGRAVKGPLAEMIPALAGRPAGADAVADHYGPLLDGFVVEAGDSVDGIPALGTKIVMRTELDRSRLGEEVITFAASLA